MLSPCTIFTHSVYTRCPLQSSVPVPCLTAPQARVEEKATVVSTSTRNFPNRLVSPPLLTVGGKGYNNGLLVVLYPVHRFQLGLG